MDGGRIDGFINPVFCYVSLGSTQPTEMLIIRIMAEDLTTKRADEVFLDVIPDAAGVEMQAAGEADEGAGVRARGQNFFS